MGFQLYIYTFPSTGEFTGFLNHQQNSIPRQNSRPLKGYISNEYPLYKVYGVDY